MKKSTFAQSIYAGTSNVGETPYQTWLRLRPHEPTPHPHPPLNGKRVIHSRFPSIVNVHDVGVITIR